MILTDFHIQAFRGLQDVTLKDLAPINVVLGANNAGKTSILEALALLLRPLDPAQWIQVARLRDMDIFLEDGLWSLFPSSEPLHAEDSPKQTAPLEISGTLQKEQRILRARGLASLNWDSEASESLMLRIEAKVNDLATHTMEFRRETPAQFGNGVIFHKCFTVTSATHRSTRNLVEHLSKVVDMGEKKLALELLQLFDPHIEGLDVSAPGGREGVRVSHKKRGVVDLSSFGDGMRRAAALALALVRSRGGILLVDELESGIHPQILPKVLQQLFLAAKTAGTQIVATTHSLEAMDMVIEISKTESSNSLAAYYLQQEGTPLLHRYDLQTLINLRDTGFDVR
ncbi:MAG TPA: AAA family ATPase [Synergistaceae bacterium]|nr:AAA family ATPase [Synergistaceae bacterium]HPJ26370.1 AAA family ATPase [Synergistaceae bacterium]